MTALRPRDRSGFSGGSTLPAKRAGSESPRHSTLHRPPPLHRRSLDLQLDPADASDEAWDLWYSRFVSWPADSEGRRLIPSTYETPDGYRIGRWQENQRQAHRRGKLPSSRVARLESAGIVWDALEAAWGEAYYKFLELPPDHRGYRSVAQGYVDKDGFKLGMWQTTQRMSYKQRKLSRRRFLKLDAAGFVWDPFEASWYEALYRFETLPFDDKMRRIVPQSYVMQDGFKLGLWQTVQRRAYKKGVMPKERIERLEAAGIVWDPHELAWEEGFKHFSAFEEDVYGKRNVPTGFRTEGGYNLGLWLENQRQARKKGTLSEERFSKLHAAGVLWDPIQGIWEKGFRHFYGYPVDTRGHRVVPQTFVCEDGFALGAWQSQQRQLYKKAKLPEDRVDLLEAAGIIWDAHAAAWEEGFAHFLSIKEDEFGRRLVPVANVTSDGFHLGAWQEKQRLSYRKGQLSASRVERLESIGVVWDGRREALNASRASQQNAKAAVCRGGGGAGANRTWRHRHLAEMPTATSPRHAPRSPQGGLVAAWHQEWRERIGCWWLGLPLATQTRLGECLGAVSFHLGSRLDALLGRRGSRRAGTVESGCEWVQRAESHLALPKFPSLDGVEFTLPPLPRLIPSWEQLHSIQTNPHPRVGGGLELQPAALGAGMGALAIALAAGWRGSVRRKRRKRVGGSLVKS